MHPAISIVLFSTLSGVGFGLMAALGLGSGPDDTAHAVVAAVLAGALASAGLAASTFHLRRPGRAWRAFSQWRSSWLSREGVLALATVAVFALYAALWILAGRRSDALGAAVALLAAATVVSTAMIYAQLRTVPRWATPLTPAAYLAFAAAGGALLAAALSPREAGPVMALSPLAVIAAWAVKLAWWRRAADATLASAGGSPEAATGLGTIGRVAEFERPHTGGNYLLREMVFVVARRRAAAVRRIALALGGIVPLAASAGSAALGGSPVLACAAALSYLLGLLFERWLFFAEAEHVVGAYYGRR